MTYLKTITSSFAALGLLAGVHSSAFALCKSDPFKKGGCLSIHKIPVPKPLRIHVKHPVDLWPYCWGAPQDCRPVKTKQQPQQTAQVNEPTKPYFVVTRYICMSKRTGKLSGREVDVTSRSAVSCQDAADKAKSFAANVGDPCKHANNEIDADQYVGSSTNVQGGICSGY